MKNQNENRNHNEDKKNKHMTLDDRFEIQSCLGKGMSFKDIAKRIGKDPTTVSKEVKLHAKARVNGFTKTDECCPKLMKAPFVCNGCPKRPYANCPYVRRVYDAKTAYNEYKEVLSDSREGIPLSKEEFYETERIISSAVHAGQHVYHAIQSNNLSVSKSTVYRHINLGYYSCLPVDLPRAVKFKSRAHKRPDSVPKKVRIGRTYEDYQTFVTENPSIPCVEMDTVIGRQGGKVIMTFIFVGTGFMFGILLDNKTAAEASSKIITFKEMLAGEGFLFGEVFPLLLTDNGGEFSNAQAFENDLEGNKETSLFFCDPNASYQKPHVENNHTLLRSIAPKGTSFDDFTQETVNLIFSHVNGVKRKLFNGKSAYDMFEFTYSAELAAVLGISKIPPEKVVQSPALLRDFFQK